MAPHFGAPEVVFNPATLDLEADVLGPIAEDILDSELPHLCEVRPHEDPLVEAWLQRWVDGEDAGADRLGLEVRCLAPLLQLAMERPELCPNFCGQLTEFERAVQDWLYSWPRIEPPRPGAKAAPGAPTAEDLELELHGVLAMLRGEVYALSLSEEGRQLEMRQPSIALGGEPADSFRSVAMGWVLKLDLLYGMHILQQPDRMAAAVGPAVSHGLSLTRWDVDQVEQLLACAFFRPDEDRLWKLAQQWLQESGSGDEESEARLSQALAPDLLEKQDAGEAGEEYQAAEPVRVRADSFEVVPRHGSCTMAAFADSSALKVEQPEGSPAMRWKNAAQEDQILGASRQLLASKVLMAPASGGVFRMDLRVLSGADAEGAHLFEVGVAVERESGRTGVCFGPGGARAPGEGSDEPDVPSFFPFFDARDILLEGVRLVLEVDVSGGVARVRNVPAVAEDDDRHSSLVAWMQSRCKVAAKDVRPPGERDCHLFREHAHHLQDLVDRGRLDRELSAAVRADAGVQAVHAAGASAEIFAAPESYCFYVVVPVGMEVEIF